MHPGDESQRLPLLTIVFMVDTMPYELDNEYAPPVKSVDTELVEIFAGLDDLDPLGDFGDEVAVDDIAPSSLLQHYLINILGSSSHVQTI